MKQNMAEITSYMIRIHTKLNKIEAKQDMLYQLFQLHLGDAEHVSELQSKLNDAKAKIRELETELYLERKAREQ